MAEKIFQAVAAVFVFDGRVLLVRRQPYLKAFPGYTAFPGGKIESEDYENVLDGSPWDDFPSEHMAALVRECDEELALSLIALAKQGMIQRLSRVGEATTPPLQPFRFQTFFYRIELSALPAIEANADELAQAQWLTGHELNQLFERGQLLAVPPVVSFIRQMAENPVRDRFDSIDFACDYDREVPCLEVLRDVWVLPVLSQTLPPANRTNAFVIGEYLIDPSPRDSDAMERLISSLSRFSLRGVVLTHHHPDHYQDANVLARRLRLPMLMSKDTHERISAKRGDAFFDELSIHFLKEGDTLTRWLGQTVRVYEVPGHDAGQIGFAPESMDWFLVGDLIQGIGTVVIAAPEGDMRTYFATLERVIAMNPAVIMPSHGLPMGTVYRLEATLAHRRQREAQVLELAREGSTRAVMLDTIYANLDPRLRPLAMANIDAHLEKLFAEGALERTQ